MDKMTDAKIRLWLKNHNPAILENYTRYQTESLADFSLPDDGPSSGPEPLRTWLENRHPDILAQIPLW